MSALIPSDDTEDRYYYHTDENGNLHKIDSKTGNVISSSPRFEDGLIPGKQMDPSFIKGNSRYWHYNEIYRDLIANHIAAGKTITEICKLPGFPSSSILARWRAQHEDFNEAILAARKMRAEHYADKIAESLEETKELDKEQVPAEKLYYDKLKWLAEKNNPAEYGSKVVHAGDSDNPLQLIVDTGIDRKKEEPVTIEGEYYESTKEQDPK